MNSSFNEVTKESEKAGIVRKESGESSDSACGEDLRGQSVPRDKASSGRGLVEQISLSTPRDSADACGLSGSVSRLCEFLSRSAHAKDAWKRGCA